MEIRMKADLTFMLNLSNFRSHGLRCQFEVWLLGCGKVPFPRA